MAWLQVAFGLGVVACAGGSTGRAEFHLSPGAGLDAFVPIPEDNPLTAAKVELGRRLFFDVRLSADGRVACATCHHPERAFADSVRVPPGVFGRTGRRNAPSLVNVAWARSLFWDGRAATLEEQALVPFLDTLELGLSVPELERRVDAFYRRPFRRAFDDGVTAGNIARVLASYVRMLKVGGTLFDRFRAGEVEALSPAARRGFDVFLSRGSCTACHLGPNLTDESFHNTGVSWGADPGRYAVTGVERDRGRFSTPSLRSVACTAPYMHDGRLRSLEDVVDHYDRGGGANPNLDADIRPLGLSASERADLLAFLRSLDAGCEPIGSDADSSTALLPSRYPATGMPRQSRSHQSTVAVTNRSTPVHECAGPGRG